jgi:hypothetical protein
MAVFMFSGYKGIMDLRSDKSAQQALQIWQARQNTDGGLVAVLAIAASIPTLRFVLSPDPQSAWVMCIFLVALGMAAFHLVNSAAMVARIRESFDATFSPQHAMSEIIEAQILDVYEQPGALKFPRSTSAYWLPGSNGRISDPQHDISLQLLRIEEDRNCQARNRARQ